MADKFQKRRIAAYLVLFVSIIAIATGIYVKFIGSKIHAEDDTKVILQTIANYKKYQLVTWINERLADANALSSNLNIIQEISKLVDVPQSVSSSRFIFSRFQAYVNYKGYKSIFLIDTKGNVIFDYSGGKEIVGKNTISEALEALKYTEAIVGDYTWCNLHAERHLDVCVPIFRNYEHKSDPVAILVFRTNSSEFIEQTVTKWPHPSVTGQGILAKVENDSIYFLTQYYDNEEDGQFRSVPLSTDKKELLPILDSSPHVRLIINSFGKKAFVYTLPLKIKNWYLSVMIDYSEAMLPARNILIRSISYGVLIFIGICLILWLSLSQIRKHEVKLQQLHEIEKQTLIKHFEYIVRFTNDAVVLTNGEDRIIEFNDTALKIYKYDIEEFRQLKFSILESEKTNPQTALEENQDAKIYETLHLDKHGREIPVEISIHSFEIQDEIYVQRIIRDISERNRTEAEKKRLYQELSDTNASLQKSIEENNQKLKNLNQELQAFYYSVSHDLKAPLRSISGFSEALIESFGSELDTKANDYLHRIFKGTMEMSALMDDLLKLSRISQHEIERRLIVPEPVIQSIVSRIKEQYPDWKGTIECMVHDQICADYKLFQVVLENGIANAVKFTSKTANPVINIDSYIESGSTVICFADNGVGFDMKHVDRLFNPFQRLHHQDDFPGRGIGLSIIRRIMDKHEGRTWIESVVGQGTKLFVAFENVCI